MDNFVDIYLENLNQERPPRRRREFWPSSVFLTDREIAEAMLAVNQPPLSDIEKLRMEDGIMYHDYLTRGFIRANKPESDWFFMDGRHLGSFRKTYKDIVTISGTPDVIAIQRNAGSVIPIEIKSAKHESLRGVLKEDKPQAWHADQVQQYLWVGGWDLGAVYYKDKNLGEMHQFDVPKDIGRIKYILDRFYFIAETLQGFDWEAPSEEAEQFIEANFKKEPKYPPKKEKVVTLSGDTSAQLGLMLDSYNDLMGTRGLAKANLAAQLLLIKEFIKPYKADIIRTKDYEVYLKRSTARTHDRKVIKELVELEIVPETVAIEEELVVRKTND